jgi:hypothetical protein
MIKTIISVSEDETDDAANALPAVDEKAKDQAQPLPQVNNDAGPDVQVPDANVVAAPAAPPAA